MISREKQVFTGSRRSTFLKANPKFATAEKLRTPFITLSEGSRKGLGSLPEGSQQAVSGGCAMSQNLRSLPKNPFNA
jgi:hypothetical protein